MRLLAVLVGIFVLIPAVSGVGILVPSDIDGDQTLRIREGSTAELNFVIRGDATNNTIDFFITPAVSGYVEFNDNPSIYQRIELDPYEEYKLTVLIDALQPINGFDVTYGFSYVGNNDGDIGFQQVVASDFKIKVLEGYHPAVVETTPVVEETTSSGSGGGYPTSTVTVEEEAPAESEPVVEAPIQDVTGSETALSQAVVDDNPALPTTLNTRTSITATGETVQPREGKSLATVLLVMMFMTLLLGTYTYRVAQEVDEI